jgi:hypothetical protein
MGSPKQADGTMWVVAALIVLLIIVVYILAMRSRKSRGGGGHGTDYQPIDCSTLPASQQPGCKQGVQACSAAFTGSDVNACESALGACWPIADYALKQSGGSSGAPGSMTAGPFPPGMLDMLTALPDCAKAVAQISPIGVASAVTAMDKTACLPQQIVSTLDDPKVQKAVDGLADAVPTLVEWSYDVAQKLPVCKSA